MNSNLLKFIQKKLFAQEDISSLVFFRISFGLLMFWEVIRFFYHGWVEHLYAKPEFHFKYEWFTWVEAWPGNGMHIHFALLGVLALFITFGFFYRIASFFFFIGYTYVFLIERALYNNHYYVICLLSFLLFLAPLHRSFSIDALRKKVVKSDKLPALWLWLFRLEMGIVYFYGGLAKLDRDWLNGNAPEALFRIATFETPLAQLIEWKAVPVFFGWSGFIFDLIIPFIMLWKPTRIPAFIMAVFFHTHNYFVFTIGIFPVLALVLTMLYFEPDFPKKISTYIIKYWKFSGLLTSSNLQNQSISIPGRPYLILLSIFTIWQLIFPFRHLFTPGWTSWHQEGHLFAWRMMLVQKNVQMLFEIKNPETGEIRYAPPEDYLNIPQKLKLARSPDMILQFSHYLKALVIKNAGFTPEILVTIKVGINGRDYKDFIKPDFDLGKIKPFSPAYEWALPFEPKKKGLPSLATP